MQNKVYTIQFFSPPHDQSPSSNCGFPRANKFCRCYWTHEFCRTRQTHGKVRTHGKKIPAPAGQPPFINWAWCPWYRIFISASLSQLPDCTPSHLQHTCSLAEHGRLEKVIDFLAMTKNINVLSTFFFY